MKVSVFGNPDLEKDKLVVEMVPRLRRVFKGVKFEVEDPTEGLKPPEKGLWVILDVAEGIEEVRLVEAVEELRDERRVSLHDYDVGMEVKLLKKVGKIEELRIIAVPMGMNREAAFKAVRRELEKIIPKELSGRE